MATRQTRLNEPVLDESLLPFRMRAVSIRPRTSHVKRLRMAPARSRTALGSLQYPLRRHGLAAVVAALLTKLGLRTEYGPFFRIFDRDYLDAVYRGQRPFNDARTPS